MQKEGVSSGCLRFITEIKKVEGTPSTDPRGTVSYGLSRGTLSALLPLCLGPLGARSIKFHRDIGSWRTTRGGTLKGHRGSHFK